MNRRSNQHRIELANEQSIPLDGQPLIAAVQMILEDHEIRESEISIAIVDDPMIRELNRNYLGHDYETDVISFPLDSDPQNRFLSGQLVVSLDTAALVSAELGIPCKDELLLYVVHGTLHLVGFDDKTRDEKIRMRAAENKYLRRSGITYTWPEQDDGDRRLASNQQADL